MDQPTTILTENAVVHLCEAAKLLPSAPPYNLLKSYYLTKSRALTLSGPVTLPQRFIKSSIRCPRCCMLHEDAPTSYRLQPERKKSRFLRRLLKKNTSGGNFTHYQEVYMKKFTRTQSADAYNSLVITCDVCKHKTVEKLKKPEKRLDETIEENVAQQISGKSRKKRKKDRFSGLNEDAVLAATPQIKSFGRKTFTPLNTPVAKTGSIKTDKLIQKNLFSNQYHRRDSGNISKKDAKNKEKKLKGLQNVLNESKKKVSPSATLKQFLTGL